LLCFSFSKIIIKKYTVSSIAPAISNGLSFDAKTGTISGTPIVASDVVTYTVTAILMTYTMSEVDRHAQDTATVVIAVGVGDISSNWILT
jgi:hypothetical protein